MKPYLCSLLCRFIGCRWTYPGKPVMERGQCIEQRHYCKLCGCVAKTVVFMHSPERSW